METKVIKAVEETKSLVFQTGSSGEKQYFEFHEKRFLKMASSVCNSIEAGKSVLDIGSHYLHSSIILSKLGYAVTPMDVEEFWQLSVVNKRAKEFDFQPVICNDLENLNTDVFGKQKFDLVLFTEILEHITFNPLSFWQKIYGLVSDQSIIYLSTPNVFSLLGILRAFKNLISFKSIGISVDDIFGKVTYGHHWKEYSSNEVKSYFHQMSDAFNVKVSNYSYFKRDNSSLKLKVLSLIIALGNTLKFTSSDLEAIVTIDKNRHSGWKIKPPNY